MKSIALSPARIESKDRSGVNLKNFRQWQASMRRRWCAAARSEPYKHRAWDRGFDIYQQENAA